MSFDWKSFLEREGIEYLTDGKNVSRGCLCIHCPFCGAGDKSEHLNINPDDGNWWCWRNREHKARKPTALVAALKGITFAHAREVVGEADETDSPGSDTVSGLRQRLEGLGKATDSKFPDEFAWDPDIRPIRANEASSARFLAYLAKRKFHDPVGLCQYYGLRYAMVGRFAWRLIMPITIKGKLVGWTGRTLRKDAELRYLSHPGPIIKEALFNEQPASFGGKVLLGVEGPLDAYKLDYIGRRYGVRAVGTMGTNFTNLQVARFADLLPRFERAVILFDPNADHAALHLKSALAVARRPIMLDNVQRGVEDAGAMRYQQVVAACKIWCNGGTIGPKISGACF